MRSTVLEYNVDKSSLMNTYKYYTYSGVLASTARILGLAFRYLTKTRIFNSLNGIH